MKGQMNFKKYYKTPFYLEFNKVFTVDNNMAFDFPSKYLTKGVKYAELDEPSKRKIVNCLNGLYLVTNHYEYMYKNGKIFIKSDDEWLLFITIRGWGSLIGIGGFNIHPDKAALIQDEFANWIIKTLRNE